MSFQISVSFRYVPRSWIAGSYSSSIFSFLKEQSPAFLHQGLVSWKTIFPQIKVRMFSGWFKYITFTFITFTETFHLLHALYFYHNYIVIYNEIILQLTTVQNQWEPWTCFPETRWSYLGVMGDNDTQSMLLISSLFLYHILVAITAENPASQRYFAGNGSKIFSDLCQSQDILPWL